MTYAVAVADREPALQVKRSNIASRRSGYSLSGSSLEDDVIAVGSMRMPLPKWDEQLPNVLRSFPHARVVQSRTRPGAQYGIYVPRFPLGSLYNKPHTNLWVPFPVCFPMMPSGSGLFTWFDAFTDADVRCHWGGLPKQTTLASPLIDGGPTLHWRGSIRHWDPYRDGLYTLLMIVHQRLSRSRR